MIGKLYKLKENLVSTPGFWPAEVFVLGEIPCRDEDKNNYECGLSKNCYKKKVKVIGSNINLCKGKIESYYKEVK